MRRLWQWVLVLLGLFFLVRYREAFLQALQVLLQGQWTWIVLALGFQAGWLVHTTLLLWMLYRRLAIPERPWRLALIVMSSLFLNLAAPTAGISGVAIFAADAHRRGHSASRALVAGTLYIFFEHFGFLALMFLGLAVLVRRNRLTWLELSAALAMVLLVSLLLALVLGAWWAPRWLHRRLGPQGPQIQSALHKPRWHQRLQDFIHDLAQGLHTLPREPGSLLPLWLAATTNKLWHLAVMASAFHAFALPLSPGTLLGAYVIVHLFFVVSPVPGGIGIAEGMLIMLLHSFGFVLHDAMAVTLTYRAVTFWLPFLVGMVGLRYLFRSSAVYPAERSSPLSSNSTPAHEVTHAATTGTLRAE